MEIDKIRFRKSKEEKCPPNWEKVFPTDMFLDPAFLCNEARNLITEMYGTWEKVRIKNPTNDNS